jgi:hypothetical protein
VLLAAVRAFDRLPAFAPPLAFEPRSEARLVSRDWTTAFSIFSVAITAACS